MGISPEQAFAHPEVRTVINIKAKQLRRHFLFRRERQEEMEQELWAHLCARLPKFNPLRGTLPAFVNVVLANHVRTLITRRTAQKRRSVPTWSLEDSEKYCHRVEDLDLEHC